VASLSQGRTAAAQCGLFTYKSVPVIFEPPCTFSLIGLFHLSKNWFHEWRYGYLVSVLCQSPYIRNTNMMFQKLDVFTSSGGRVGEATTEMGQIERAVLSDWVNKSW